jgi:MerR family transcriptional regulator, redox-sensitive transcriptional activator SoxR
MPSELTIGEVASRSGVAPSALRFYEDEGLIVSSRTAGNQRRYERAVLRRIALIQAGRAAGIPLDRIRAALATLPAHRTPNRRDWERLSRGWREDIDSRIASLEALRNRLTTLSSRPRARGSSRVGARELRSCRCTRLFRARLGEVACLRRSSR